MSYTDMPGNIEEYLPAVWKNGTLNWFYVNSTSFTYVYLYNLDFSAEQALLVDSVLDDGNIATGDVRMAFNGSGLIYLFRYSPFTPDTSDT
jgi:hypothetical protein